MANSIPIVSYARTNNSLSKGSFCGSVKEQHDAIKFWAKFNNCHIIEEYQDECISGITKKPVGLNRLINDIKDNKIQIEYVLVCQFNRVSRNLGVFHWFKKELNLANIKLISLSESCEYNLNGSSVGKNQVLSLKKVIDTLINYEIGNDNG